jgi:hypothetical protein
MRRSGRVTLMVGGLIVASVAFFQSCSDPLLDMSEQSSFAEKLPFAYDTTLDTIAYMSCAGGTTSANRNAIWSFRVGAFASGNGIRLTDSFLNSTSTFSASQRAAALAESTKNKGAVLQLAVRQALNYQSILTSGGGSGEMGEDFATLLGPLDDPAIAGKISAVDTANPQRLVYLAGVPGLTGRTVEGALRFTVHRQ